jgi:RNA polymerase sigma-70 factor (ECF subfamily)
VVDLLIRRCQVGDEEAFAELFHQYTNLVYKTAYLLLDSAEEAEDALQEVMLQVHRSLSTFDPTRGAFTTWLHRVTVNHCLSRRRKWRLPGISLERQPALLTEQPAFPEQVEDEEMIVGYTRIELLSNLPIEEIIKVAEGLTAAR